MKKRVFMDCLCLIGCSILVILLKFPYQHIFQDSSTVSYFFYNQNLEPFAYVVWQIVFLSVLFVEGRKLYIHMHQVDMRYGSRQSWAWYFLKRDTMRILIGLLCIHSMESIVLLKNWPLIWIWNIAIFEMIWIQIAILCGIYTKHFIYGVIAILLCRMLLSFLPFAISPWHVWWMILVPIFIGIFYKVYRHKDMLGEEYEG